MFTLNKFQAGTRTVTVCHLSPQYLYCIFCFGHSPFSYLRNTGFLFKVKIIPASISVVLQKAVKDEGAAFLVLGSSSPVSWRLVHHRGVSCPRLFYSQSLFPAGALAGTFCVCRCSHSSISTKNRARCFVLLPFVLQQVWQQGRPGLERSSSRGGSGTGWSSRGTREAPEARGEQESSGPGAEARQEPRKGWRGAGNQEWDRAEAVMRQGQYSWQRNWSAGCSTWLFKFDLINLRSFFHLMLCRNWFYLPLIFFSSLPLLLWINN